MYRRVALLLAIAAAVAPAQSTKSAVIDALRSRLEADVAAEDVGGLSAAVVFGDSVVWSQGFGWADRAKRVPASRATVYRIGSITKTFTALVLAQLVDRKIISLDDPVERFLPEIRTLGKSHFVTSPVTFRQLASHTAGITRDARLPGIAIGPATAWQAKALSAIGVASFDTTPGARYAYSNVGFALLGLALERAARTPFIRLVEDGVLRPIGSRSAFTLNSPMRADVAVGYVVDPVGRITQTAAAAQLDGMGYAVPAGALFATTDDLARLVRDLTSTKSRIISDSMRSAMMTKQSTLPGLNGYGLGLQMSVERGVKVVGHGGVTAGYFAAVAFDRETRIGVILLRNYDGSTPLVEVANQTVRDLVAERHPAIASTEPATPLLPGVPNTSAGRALSDWISAINSGDLKQLDTFREKWFGRVVEPSTPDELVPGGYDVQRVIESTDTRVVVIARERAELKPFVRMTAAVFPQRPNRLTLLGMEYIADPATPTPAALSPGDDRVARQGQPFRVLTAWLDAFNEGSDTRIQQFLDTHWRPNMVKAQIDLRVLTGGFELLRLTGASDHSITGVLQQRGRDGYRGFMLRLTPSDPSRILRFATFPVPRP